MKNHFSILGCQVTEEAEAKEAEWYSKTAHRERLTFPLTKLMLAIEYEIAFHPIATVSAPMPIRSRKEIHRNAEFFTFRNLKMHEIFSIITLIKEQ